MSDPLKHIVFTAPIITAGIIAPCTYQLAKRNGTPIFKAGSYYSGGSLTLAILLNAGIFFWGDKNMKKGNGTAGFVVIGMAFGTALFMTSHLVSYWGILYATCHRQTIWAAAKKIFTMPTK
jgi:hypothetical protein